MELLDHKLISKPEIRPGTTYNYAYYPVLLKDESTLHRVMDELKKEGVLARRYFYPSLNTLPYIEKKYSCPVSEDVSVRVLSLPLFIGLEKTDKKKIASAVLKAI